MQVPVQQQQLSQKQNHRTSLTHAERAQIPTQWLTITVVTVESTDSFSLTLALLPVDTFGSQCVTTGLVCRTTKCRTC
jgi:hypothetical protein